MHWAKATIQRFQSLQNILHALLVRVELNLLYADKQKWRGKPHLARTIDDHISWLQRLHLLNQPITMIKQIFHTVDQTTIWAQIKWFHHTLQRNKFSDIDRNVEWNVVIRKIKVNHLQVERIKAINTISMHIRHIFVQSLPWTSSCPGNKSSCRNLVDRSQFDQKRPFLFALATHY